MYFRSDPNQKDSLWITMFHPQSVQLIFQDVPQSVLLCNMTFELRNVVFKRFPGIPIPSDGGWEWSPLECLRSSEHGRSSLADTSRCCLSFQFLVSFLRFWIEVLASLVTLEVTERRSSLHPTLKSRSRGDLKGLAAGFLPF